MMGHLQKAAAVNGPLISETTHQELGLAPPDGLRLEPPSNVDEHETYRLVSATGELSGPADLSTSSDSEL